MEQGRTSARMDGLEEREREEGGKERERRALAAHLPMGAVEEKSRR